LNFSHLCETDKADLSNCRGTTLLLLQLFYGPLDFFWDYPGEPHQKGKTRKVNVPIWIYWSKR